MEGFAGLPRNWDSYGAKKINPVAIRWAKELLDKLGDGWIPVPTPEGGVQLEWHRDGVDIEIDICEALKPGSWVTFTRNVEDVRGTKASVGEIGKLLELHRVQDGERIYEVSLGDGRAVAAGEKSFVRAYGYWRVVRYFRDLISGECRNLGILLWSQGKWRFRFVEDLPDRLMGMASKADLEIVEGYIREMKRVLSEAHSPYIPWLEKDLGKIKLSPMSPFLYSEGDEERVFDDLFRTYCEVLIWRSENPA
jgi:hypothetical protein